jgi:DNA-binding MarR family transcriptional regulator
LSPDDARLAALCAALKKIQNDLSLAEFVALLAVGVEPGLSVNELSERIGAPQQSTSRYVSVLTGRYPNPSPSTDRRPFITQGVKQNDPRSRSLHLADRGQEVVNDILQAASLDAKDAFHVGL